MFLVEILSQFECTAVPGVNYTAKVAITARLFPDLALIMQRL